MTNTPAPKAYHLPDYVTVGAKLADYHTPNASRRPVATPVEVIRVNNATVTTKSTRGAETRWTLDKLGTDAPTVTSGRWDPTHYLLPLDDERVVTAFAYQRAANHAQAALNAANVLAADPENPQAARGLLAAAAKAAGVPDAAAAAQRVAAYIESLTERHTGIDHETVHTLDGGVDMGGTELRVSDLRALLAAVAR